MQIALLRRYVANVIEEIRLEIPLNRIMHFIAMGGDMRFVASQIGGAEPSCDRAIPRDQFLAFCDEVERLDEDRVIERFRLPAVEAATLGPALMVNRALLSETAARRVLVSDASLRAGILLDATVPRGRGTADEFERQVLASADALGSRYRLDRNHGQHVAALAACLFDELREEHGLGDRERLLLKVASLLLDVGIYISPRAHHKHSQYILAESQIFGLSAEETAIVSNIARYHRRGTPQRTHVPYVALDRRDRSHREQALGDSADRQCARRRARAEGARVAHCARGSTWVLQLDGSGDVTMERLAATARADMFVETFGRQLLVQVPGEGRHTYVLLEEIIRAHLAELFPGQPIVEARIMRLARDAALELDDEGRRTHLEAVEREIRRRRRSDVVRLEVESVASAELVARLLERLDLQPDDVYFINGPIDLRVLMPLTELPAFEELKDPPFRPANVLVGREHEDLFSVLDQRDLLMHHPYDGYEPVILLLDQAARDPDVLAIKQTLYRTSARSKLIESLQRAADSNKQVMVLVELTARFDEERNIQGARALEEAGAHVIYGVRGYKTHAKISLIVKRTPDGLRRYVHLGTGNYNERTRPDVYRLRPDDERPRDRRGCRIEQVLQRTRELLAASARATHRQKCKARSGRISGNEEQPLDRRQRACRLGLTHRLSLGGLCSLRRFDRVSHRWQTHPDSNTRHELPRDEIEGSLPLIVCALNRRRIREAPVDVFGIEPHFAATARGAPPVSISAAN